MDANFADLKKEAAATADDTYKNVTNAKKQIQDFDLLDESKNVSSGAQDDNAHTEHYFANEQKNLDFGNLDPQIFVQRMSAEAKEAQEQLDAKFAQKNEEIGDFQIHADKDFQQIAKQGVSGITSDFLNTERVFFGGFDGRDGLFRQPAAVVSNQPSKAVSTVADLGVSKTEKESEKAKLQQFPPTAPVTSDFYDGDFGLPIKSVNKDSDTDSPSISYTPSPAKKVPISGALKEQDNDKFISSEDLLSDFRDEPTSNLDSQLVAAPITTAAKTTSIPTTDLDDDDYNDFKQPSVVGPSASIISKSSTVSMDDTEFKPQQLVAATSAVPKIELVMPINKPTTGSAGHPNIVSIEEIFYKYGLDAWFKPERLHPQVESLIYWRDVKKSGIVFGAGLVILLAISCFSVISVFAYLSLLTLFGTIAFRIYKSVTQAIQKTNDGHPFKEYLELDLTISQEKVQKLAGVAVSHLNGFIAELRRLFLVEDLVDSIKFSVILWAFTYIGAWFNGMTLVILAFVSLFTVPKVYENNKESIDTYLDLVRSKLTDISDKIKVALPIGGNKKPIVTESDKDK